MQIFTPKVMTFIRGLMLPPPFSTSSLEASGFVAPMVHKFNRGHLWGINHLVSLVVLVPSIQPGEQLHS